MHLGTRELLLEIDGDEYTEELGDVQLVSAPADAGFLTFASARNNGGRKYTLTFTAVQDPSVNSLWDLMWTQPGEVVAFVLRPAGGVAPTASTPEFEGALTISEPDGTMLGGAADSSTSARFTWSATWECVAKPVRAFTV